MSWLLLMFQFGFASLPESLGHNLSPTIYGIEAQRASVGNYILGYGISERWTVASSPWIWAEYNMSNIFIRYADPSRDQSLQVGYFKNAPIFLDRYSMEATSVWWTKKLKPLENYEVHASLNVMYFFEESIPFSLRREPYKDEAYQWTLTTLHLFRIAETYRAQLELGVLGLNFWYPNYHFGVSLQKVTPNWLFQFGFSATGIFSYIGRGIHQVYQSYRNTNFRFEVDEIYRTAVSVHPEIQVQYYF